MMSRCLALLLSLMLLWTPWAMALDSCCPDVERAKPITAAAPPCHGSAEEPSLSQAKAEADSETADTSCSHESPCCAQIGALQAALSLPVTAAAPLPRPRCTASTRMQPPQRLYRPPRLS